MGISPRTTIVLESGKCVLKEMTKEFCIVSKHGKLYRMDYGRLIRKNSKELERISQEIDRFDISSMRNILSIIGHDALNVNNNKKYDIPDEYAVYIYHLSRLPKQYIDSELANALKESFADDIDRVTNSDSNRTILSQNYIINRNDSADYSSPERWDPEDLSRAMDLLQPLGK